VFDQRRAARRESSSPVTFRVGDRETEGTLVNLSATGALVRFDTSLPIGPEAVGMTVTFLSWYGVGALLKSPATAIRYFEDPEGKLIAVRYLPD